MVGDCCFCGERHCKQAELQDLFSFSEGGCSGSDLGSGLFHTTVTVNLTVNSTTRRSTFQSSGQNTEVFSTFLFFLHHLFFSFRNIGTQSHQPRQDKIWWPFRPCSGLAFGPEHLSKIGTQNGFHNLQL